MNNNVFSNIILIDICGTIYDSNTTFDFLDFYVTSRNYHFFRKISPTLAWRCINKISYLLFGKDLTRVIALRYIRGLSRDELLIAASDFYNQFLKHRIQKDVTTIIDTYRHEEVQLVLASATVDFIAQVISREVGINTYISTQLVYTNGICNGQIYSDVLGHKSKALVSMKIMPPYAVTITDNFSDVDILSLSHKSVIVTTQQNKLRWANIIQRNKLKNIDYLYV